MKLKRLQTILIASEYTFIYKYYSKTEELTIDDGADSIILHYNTNTEMLIILTFINGVVTTKNIYKFSDSIYNKIREFFVNKEEIKNFTKIVDKL